MSNLLATLVCSAGTLEAYSQVLETVQNNVSNASTPGYAKQRLQLEALPFDPREGSTGGVRAGNLINIRNEFTETAVRRQTSGMGYQQQLVDSLTTVQTSFDVSGDQGIPQALNNLLQSFAAWGATPDNPSARQSVIQRAANFAEAVQQVSDDVSTQARDDEQQISQTVDQVNQLVGQLKTYNQIVMQGNKEDGGLSARIHAALDELSTLVDVDATFQSDGTVSLMLNGETPLLMADKQFNISTTRYLPDNPPPTNPGSPANVRVQGWDGDDITSRTTGGQLGALLHLRNEILPSYIGDAYQAGGLNVMAKQFADRVNQILTSGNLTGTNPAEPGIPLFTYDATDATHTAASLAVTFNFAPEQLSTITPGPPSVSNGVPLALSALASPVQAADKVDGLSYSEYYGQLAGRIGTALNDATDSQGVQQSLLRKPRTCASNIRGCRSMRKPPS